MLLIKAMALPHEFSVLNDVSDAELSTMPGRAFGGIRWVQRH